MRNSILPFYQPTQKVVVSSADCYQYDEEDKQYIDFDSGVWCANLGHSHPDLIKAIEHQMKVSFHHGYKFRNYAAEQLSEKLLNLIGFKEGKSVFLSSGSEAVNLSITLAKHLTGRKKILKIDKSYLSAFGHGQISEQNEDLFTIAINDIQAIEHIDFSQMAAFVFEPGTSFGLVHFPAAEFVDLIAQKAKAANCRFICDEVTSGFGRTGKWFGHQHYQIQPDMVVCGKALGNGYPVSALCVNAQTAMEFELAPFRYAQSHQNDPLGCAAGLEVIRIIEANNLLNQSVKTGLYFYHKLQTIKEKHPNKVKEIRARGLMLALELSDFIDGDLINNQLFEQGLIIGFKMNVLRFMPPLTIKLTDIDKLVDAIDQLLSEHVPTN